MKRMLAMSLFLCAVALCAWAQNKTNFSGKWELDRARSVGVRPNVVSQVMTVTQDGDALKAETKVTLQQGEQTVTDDLKLDGKEYNFTPQGPQGPTGTGKRKSEWLPDGKKILVTEVTQQDTPQGKAETTITRKWSLSPDGLTLTIDFYVDTPRISYEMKRIFIKK
jgi:hypothetical protein